MLANTISCIVTSVLLNIVDGRQVRHSADCLYTILSVCCAVCSLLILVFPQGGTLNKTTKRSEQAERDSDREPLTQGEEEQNEDEEDEAVRSRSINT